MELKKFVFEDENRTKVVIASIIEETEFLFKVKAQRDGKIFDLGKRAIIKVTPVEGEGR